MDAPSASRVFVRLTKRGWVLPHSRPRPIGDGLGDQTLTACVINGYNGGSPAGGAGADQTSYYIGGTLNTPLKELKVGASVDYVQIRSQPLTGFTGAYQEVLGLFATYQLTDKLSLNGRAEYLQQSRHISALAFPSKAIETTLTAQYDLWKNVLSRVEFRWDHQAGEAFAGSVATPAYGGPGGTLYNSYELIANVVYKF